MTTSGDAPLISVVMIFWNAEIFMAEAIRSVLDQTHEHLDEKTVREGLEGNICRCTGYHNIVKSVLDGAARMKVSQAAE